MAKLTHIFRTHPHKPLAYVKRKRVYGGRHHRHHYRPRHRLPIVTTVPTREPNEN